MLQIQYCPTVLFFIFFSISILSHGIRIALKYTKKIIPKNLKAVGPLKFIYGK